jgi:hypothetical protein
MASSFARWFFRIQNLLNMEVLSHLLRDCFGEISLPNQTDRVLKNERMCPKFQDFANLFWVHKYLTLLVMLHLSLTVDYFYYASVYVKCLYFLDKKVVQLRENWMRYYTDLIVPLWMFGKYFRFWSFPDFGIFTWVTSWTFLIQKSESLFLNTHLALWCLESFRS